MFAVKHIIKLLFFLIIITSCNSGTSKEKIIREYLLDTVRIAIDESYLQHYTVVQNQVIGELLYAFNTKEHSIDIFNLKTRQAVKQLMLHKEGPDGIPSVSSFYVTPSFIVLENQYQYVIVNHEGEAKSRLLKENCYQHPEMHQKQQLQYNTISNNTTTDLATIVQQRDKN